MDLSKLRSISNDHQRVRLLSLRSWDHASEIQPRDLGGPYVVAQEGYDPDDLTMSHDEFLLGRSGQWVTTGMFLRLPRDTRRAEFVFGTAAEVISLLESLPSKAQVITSKEAVGLTLAPEPQRDDLSSAFQAAKSEPSRPIAYPGNP